MSRPATIVLASGNPGKRREIERLLADFDIAIVPQSELGIDDADETGATFRDNALIKAQHACSATGLPAISDDSGLAVDALGGRPGVYSARYAGPGASDEDNLDKLLAELDGVAGRGAAFHCVACFMAPGDRHPVFGHGEWRGEILTSRRGTGGFGYDPVFLDPASGQAAAELAPADKNARSHRGQALRELVAQLTQRFHR